MKTILVSMFLLLTLDHAIAQTITYEDFRKVIPYLQKEDFRGAFEKTKKLLNKTENDSSDLRGIVTYMNIFSSAGMVSNKEMSHEDFEKNAQKFLGQRVVMSAHPCTDSSTQGFNTLKFREVDGQPEGMTISTNKTGTSILCFEYFKYSYPIDTLSFIGKNVRCGGILKSVEINPNKSTIWIARLRVDNAFARDMDAR